MYVHSEQRWSVIIFLHILICTFISLIELKDKPVYLMILLKSYKPLEYYNALLFKMYSPRNV